ncbi:MAG: hypothetical protein QXS20_09005 [Candidatus Thorarchaeota archaeon]
MTSGTPTEPPVSDFAYNVDVANGLAASDPSGKRILVPLVAGLLGGSPLALHSLNVVVVALASLPVYLVNGAGDRRFIVGTMFLTVTRAIVLLCRRTKPRRNDVFPHSTDSASYENTQKMVFLSYFLLLQQQLTPLHL